jgi:hypothetical protein
MPSGPSTSASDGTASRPSTDVTVGFTGTTS